MFKLPLSMLAIAATLTVATPAGATVELVLASSDQGILVHGIGPLQEGLLVQGALGAGGPVIVNFTGDTTETAATSDRLRIQNGQGQADVTGAEITLGGPANDLYNMLSGNIFLTGNAAMNYIEFGLTGTGSGGSIDFIITGSDGTTNFFNQLVGSGNTHFAFTTSGDSTITNVRYVATAPLELTLLKQVRIDPLVSPVPEPATWAMMLIGFGAIGVSLRRRRRNQAFLQVA